MTRKISTGIVLSTLLIILAACKAPTETQPTSVRSLDGDFERATLIVDADNGAQHELRIYLALEFDQQRRGLMFVRNMPKDTGMLFVYEDSNIRSMWMKNTYIPLDMVFARRDGSVTNIVEDTVPLSEESVTSSEPATFVLELNAGTARRLSIDEDSRLVWEPAME